MKSGLTIHMKRGTKQNKQTKSKQDRGAIEDRRVNNPEISIGIHRKQFE